MLDKLWFNMMTDVGGVIEDSLHGVGVVLLILTAPLWLPFWLLGYLNNRM